MKIQATKKPGVGSTWGLEMLGDDGEVIDGIGELINFQPGKFQWIPGGSAKIQKSADSEQSLIIDADNINDAMTELTRRLGIINIKIPPDRLASMTMSKHAGSVMYSLMKLASKADAMPGFISALAYTLGVVIVEEVGVEEVDSLMDEFIADVEKNINGRLEENKSADDSLKAMMEKISKALQAKINEDQDGAGDAPRH